MKDQELLDYFAAAALTGLLAQGQTDEGCYEVPVASRHAWVAAQLMLEERRKHIEEQEKSGS